MERAVGDSVVEPENHGDEVEATVTVECRDVVDDAAQSLVS